MIPLLQVDGVRRSYGATTALPRYSLTVDRSGHTALVGPSGCGKSTLLRLIAGLEAADAGQITIDGKLATDASRILIPPHERGISMVFQDLALWPNLTAWENVALGLASSGLTNFGIRDRTAETMELCRIESHAKRLPAELSGGQQQRVALARALSVHPRLLLLDEPFTGLDASLKDSLIADLRKLIEHHAITLLAVTHDHAEADSMGCRAHLWKSGNSC